MSEDQSVNKESSRGLRKERVGVVSSDSMDKTIVVSVVLECHMRDLER